MQNLLYLQLENEKTRYGQLRDERRTDAIACIVLSRIEDEIKRLEGQIDGTEKAGKESFKRNDTGRFARYVREIMHRLRNHKDRGNSRVLPVPQENILQTSAGIR